MQPLSVASLLDVWELARADTLPRRALALLWAASPEQPYAQLAALPVGDRDRRLMQLREWAFGPEACGVARCPGCGEPVEMSFRLDRLREDHASQAPDAASLAGRELRSRLPSADDLVATLAGGDATAARRMLLERCVIERPVEGLAPSEAEALVEWMAQSDPGAAIEFALECPACAHQWLVLFDIVSFFWKEVESWACRVFEDVHALAAAYGWSEAEILALTPARRRLYVEMLG